MVFYNHSREVRPLHSRVVGPAMAHSWQVFFLIPPLPPPPPLPVSVTVPGWMPLSGLSRLQIAIGCSLGLHQPHSHLM